MLKTIKQTQRALQANQVSSLELVEQCLDAIESAAGQGASVFTKVHKEQAIAQAKAIDYARAHGVGLAPFAGVPITVKDLFDVAGDVTTAGSKVLAGAKPAQRDAVIVDRLKQAGFVIMGRTNMTEFAYSGLGMNPHYGTPLNPYDRENGRIPGGSSSGAAIALTDGMASGSIGTDTGGSCRIPAALSGIVGFKSTARRIDQTGTLPLSFSLDSIGPLAKSVECCTALDAVLANIPQEDTNPLPLNRLRLAIPQSIVLDDMDNHVARTFEQTVQKLADQGAIIIDEPLTQLLELPQINSKGGFAAAEAYTWHHKLMEEKGDEYDPRVFIRMMKGQSQTAVDYIELLQARQRVITSVAATTAQYDALIYPTVPKIAPLLSQLDEDEEEYGSNNLLMLRNPSVVNFLDRCAISIPCHDAGSAPVGLSLVGEHQRDRQLLSLALSVENIVSPRRKRASDLSLGSNN
jgi:aspartyl-tRNA(Asn)/glutamyl-tRNA(Gln) amidotransferase subunit A